jgi:membrane protease YdiL (CAAX protease family)
MGPTSIGAERALVGAAGLYAAMLAWCLWNAGASLHGWSIPLGEYVPEVVLGVIGTVFVGRAARGWLAFPRMTLRGSALAAGALLVAFGSAHALGLAVHMSDDLMMLEFRAFRHGLWLALFFISGVTPVLEEWLFRGTMLELLMAVFARQTAVVVTALLFAFMHLTPLTIVHHGLVGLVCGRVRLATGSLWPAIGCHAAYNALVVLTTW